MDSLTHSGLSVYGAQVAYGRVVIVHRGDLNISAVGQSSSSSMPPPPSPPPSPPASPPPRLSGTAAGCAAASRVHSHPSLPYAIVEIGQYPGADRGQHAARPQCSLPAARFFNGFVTGLEPGQKGGWHVHSGFTCDDAAKVGGHYFEAGFTDLGTPSNSFYEADANGVATISHEEPDFTLYDDMQWRGAPSCSTSTDSAVKIGCGVTMPMKAQSARSATTRGTTAAARCAGCSPSRTLRIRLRTHGTIVGLEPDGRLVHPLGVQPRRDQRGRRPLLRRGRRRRPWNIGNTFYQADAKGVAQIDKTMPSLSMHLQDVLPVYGRTVVVHLASNSAEAGVRRDRRCVWRDWRERPHRYYARIHGRVKRPGRRVVGYVDGTLTVKAVLSGLGSG